MHVALDPTEISFLQIKFSPLRFNCSRSLPLFTAHRTSGITKTEKKLPQSGAALRILHEQEIPQADSLCISQTL